MNAARNLKSSMLSPYNFIIVIAIFCSISSAVYSADDVYSGMDAARAVFLKKRIVAPRDLYKMAHEAFSTNRLDEARLYALRIFFDGFRSTSLLDLLGGIEIKADKPLLAGAWLRKALTLDQNDATARKLLTRLPPPPRPIPVEPAALQDHFAQITGRLPQLLNRLTNAKLHSESILDEIARGQFYKALALAEEYEKRYPGVEGKALTALCALYLGRIRDAINLYEEGLAEDPCHPLLLFTKAIVNDLHPETSASSRPRALYDLDRWVEAEKTADTFTQMFPKSAEGLLVKARMALDRMQPRKAQIFLDQAAMRDPDNPVLDMLRIDLAIMSGEPEKAGDLLRRAFRRGYNLPSVNLKAGLLAAANARPEDAKAILDDAADNMPFLDRDAWPLYVQLAIINNRSQNARHALDLWSVRLPRRSMACYMESLYWFKVGDISQGLSWLKKAFSMNPDQITILNSLAAVPTLSQAPQLAQGIMVRLMKAEEEAKENPALPQKIEPIENDHAPTPLPPDPTKASGSTINVNSENSVESNITGTNDFSPALASEPLNMPAIAQPSSNSSNISPNPYVLPEFPMNGPSLSSTRFTLKSAAGVATNVVGIIMQCLETTLNRLEPFLGKPKESIVGYILPDTALKTEVAHYYPDKNILAISTIYTDLEALKTRIAYDYPDIDEETAILLSQAVPGHETARELAKALLHARVPKALEPGSEALWLTCGISEILGGSDDVIKYLLQSVQTRIASGETKLVKLEEVNAILADAGASIAARDTARAQAYLMTAFLIKKKADFNSGMAAAIQLLELINSGKPLNSAITEATQLSRDQFDAGWKEAAFWSLKQGIPYQW